MNKVSLQVVKMRIWPLQECFKLKHFYLVSFKYNVVQYLLQVGKQVFLYTCLVQNDTRIFAHLEFVNVQYF